MQAAYINTVGPPENIRIGDLPLPNVGPKDILVRVAAVCVDPIDTYIRSGAYPIELPTPFIIGRDLVGTVERIGSSVTGFTLGERVWCNNQGYAGRQGSFAEYAAVDESLLYKLPSGVDELQAVSFVHAALTASVGMKKIALQPGDSLFVQGGAGNVGSAILQLARAGGIRTFATAGNADGLAWCHKLGAEVAIDYHNSEELDKAVRRFAPEGVTAYWDTSGHHNFEQAVAWLGHHGRLVLMSGLNAKPVFPVGGFYTKNCTLYGFTVTSLTPDELRLHAAAINDWFASGELQVRIDRVLSLADAAEAHRLVEAPGAVTGKIVIKIRNTE
jgi:NADPH:quinone reductase